MTTLSKKLILDAINPNDQDILILEDPNNPSDVINLISMGEFEFDQCHYLFGMEYSDYEDCFQNASTVMIVEFWQIEKGKNGDCVYLPCDYFSPQQEYEVYNIIKAQLENVVMQKKIPLQ